MNILNFMNIADFEPFVKLFDSIIPDNINESFEIDGNKIHVSKKDGKLKVNITDDCKITSECFDDTNVKHNVALFKKNIDEIDDNLFVEIAEELENHIDLKEFDRLLDLESFNFDEASKVSSMLCIASDKIKDFVDNKILKLQAVYNKF